MRFHKQHKTETMKGRQRVLDMLTADGKTPSFDSVWAYLKTAKLVEHCTKCSFRDSIYKHGMGMKEGRVHDRRLSLSKSKPKLKRYPPKPAKPMYKHGVMDMIIINALKIGPYLQGTFK
jgi:hypothetical protein